jgi:hypothetical protein
MRCHRTFSQAESGDQVCQPFGGEELTMDGIGRDPGESKGFGNGAPNGPGQKPNAGGNGRTRPRLRLLKWRPVAKGALRGFADVEFWFGLKIADCPVLVSHGRAWVSFPGRPVLTDGRHRQDEHGKPAYATLLSWRDRKLQDRFSAAVIELLLEAHPGALDP